MRNKKLVLTPGRLTKFSYYIYAEKTVLLKYLKI